MRLIKYGNIYSKRFTGMSFAGNVWDSNGLSPAIKTMQGGGCEPMIIVKQKPNEKDVKSENVKVGFLTPGQHIALTQITGREQQ